MKTKFLTKGLTTRERGDLRDNALSTLRHISQACSSDVVDFKNIAPNIYRWAVNDHTHLRWTVHGKTVVSMALIYQESGRTCALEVRDTWARELFYAIMGAGELDLI